MNCLNSDRTTQRSPSVSMCFRSTASPSWGSMGLARVKATSTTSKTIFIMGFNLYQFRLPDMFRTVRRFHFSRIEAELQKFKSLELDVAAKEQEVVNKKSMVVEECRRLNEVTTQDRVNQVFSFLTGKPFHTQVVASQKQKLQTLHKKLKDLQEDGAKRAQVSKRLIEEERLKCQNAFLADLAKFAFKYKKVVETTPFSKQLKLGVELSCKHLQSQLHKNGVEFIGSEGESFDREKHERAEGEGERVDKVLQPGIRIKGGLHARARVSLKEE